MRKNFGVKSWFYPQPVLIIATYDENGSPDAMNAAWGGLYDGNKVELCLSAGHKTTKNIQATGAFTVSFADAANLVASDYVGLASANTSLLFFAFQGDFPPCRRSSSRARSSMYRACWRFRYPLTKGAIHQRLA